MLIASILAKSCGLHARFRWFPGDIVTGIKPVKIGACTDSEKQFLRAAEFQGAMIDETRLTATLPQLDVEIIRREDTDPAAQVLTISLRATPNFRAVANHLSAALPSLLPMSPVVSPFLWWTNAIAAAWLPLLAPFSVLAPPPVEGETTKNAAVVTDECRSIADD